MTSRDFAKLIGVSQSTVSRAMNNSELVPEEKRRYIHQKAREVGFVLNSTAKSLRTRRTGTIGILFPQHFVGMSANPMLAYLYDCIQREMYAYDYDIMVVYNKAEAEDFSSFERIVRTRKVDGFLVMRMELSDAEMHLIEEYEMPCVFLLSVGAKVWPNSNFLFSDNKCGGREAGRYLGRFPEYQKVVVTVRERREDSEVRLRGYREGLAESGCTLLEENILHCGLGTESAYNCVMQHRALFERQKTAVFACGDVLALGVVRACMDLGLAIPEQVQVIGIDDIPLASQLPPALSTIHVSVEEMVPRSCRLLLDLIGGENRRVQEWLKPHLVLRDTTLRQNA